jgi:hypothetical protein
MQDTPEIPLHCLLQSYFKKTGATLDPNPKLTASLGIHDDLGKIAAINQEEAPLSENGWILPERWLAYVVINRFINTHRQSRTS